MLLTLILIVWLAAILMVVALCRLAARGDSVTASIASNLDRSTDGGPVVPNDPSDVMLYEERYTARRAFLRAHGARRHRTPSEAGS